MTKEKMRVGVDLIKQLSTAFYTNINSVFNELVSNASDAFATEVRIEISGQGPHASIVVQDNGLGMTKEELVRFFYISSTHKKQEPRTKIVGNIKREIIGKFGIGKLSMYRLCNRFEITSCKQGKESCAEMDFEKFESNEFIEDFDLDITSEEVNKQSSGTLIRMLDIKESIDLRLLQRSLTKYMPLKPDFNVYLNGTKLESVKRMGSVCDIDEEIEGVGKAIGRIIITPESIGQDSRLYIRVFGRVVNESGVLPLNRLNLTHGMSYINKMYVDINVNGLDDAVLTNRAGFIEDNFKFVKFMSWLKSSLNSFIREVDAEQVKEDKDNSKLIPHLLSTNTSPTFSSSDFKENWTKLKKKSGSFSKKVKTKLVLPKSKKEVIINPDIADIEESLNKLSFGDMIFVILVKPLGKSAPECSLSKDNSKIIINSDNLFYKNAEAASLDALKLHCIKSIFVEVSLLMANGNISLFKETYDLFTKQDLKL